MLDTDIKNYFSARPLLHVLSGLCLMVFVLSSCGGSYMAMGTSKASQGYSDKQLSKNTFQVTYTSDEFTSVEKTRDFHLLRCAEITLGNKYRYFTLKNYMLNQIRMGKLPLKTPVITADVICFLKYPELTDQNKTQFGTIYDALEIKVKINEKYDLQD